MSRSAAISSAPLIGRKPHARRPRADGASSVSMRRAVSASIASALARIEKMRQVGRDRDYRLGPAPKDPQRLGDLMRIGVADQNGDDLERGRQHRLQHDEVHFERMLARERPRVDENAASLGEFGLSDGATGASPSGVRAAAGRMDREPAERGAMRGADDDDASRRLGAARPGAERCRRDRARVEDAGMGRDCELWRDAAVGLRAPAHVRDQSAQGYRLAPDRTFPRLARDGLRLTPWRRPIAFLLECRRRAQRPARALGSVPPLAENRAQRAVGQNGGQAMDAEDCIDVGYWTRLVDGRVECGLCPRFCKMRPGQRGLCFVRRAREDGEGMELTGYGRLDRLLRRPDREEAARIISCRGRRCSRSERRVATSPARSAELGHFQEHVGEVARLSAPRRRGTIARAAERLGCASVALYIQRSGHLFLEYAPRHGQAALPRAGRRERSHVTAGFVCEEAAQAGLFGEHGRGKRRPQGVHRAASIAAMRTARSPPVLDTLIYSSRETERVDRDHERSLIPGREQ